MKSTPPPTVKAVLFDLDGTLYNPRPMRRAMLMELARAPLRGPLRALRTLRQLRAFRHVREELRELGDTAASLNDVQYEVPAGQLGVAAAELRSTVEEWMYTRPLRHLSGCAWPSLRRTIETLRDGGLGLGVFSDYPPADKLNALGIGDLFDVAVAATDTSINAFKPHQRGFLVGAERLGHDPGDVLYVGDRVDVDALGAAAAGMQCVILGAPDAADGGYRGLASLADLPALLSRSPGA